MKPNVAILVLAFAAPLTCHAGADWQAVRSNDNTLLYSNQALTVRGRWMPVGAYGKAWTPVVNSVSMTCRKATMRCVESLALIDPVRNDNSEAPPFLTVLSLTYQVTEWDDDVLTARRIGDDNTPPATNENLRIEFRKGQAQKTWRAQPRKSGDWPSPSYDPSEQTVELRVAKPIATPFAD